MPSFLESTSTKCESAANSEFQTLTTDEPTLQIRFFEQHAFLDELNKRFYGGCQDSNTNILKNLKNEFLLIEQDKMKTVQHDLVVLGGGPAGYVAAIRAAQLGIDTACIDENPRFGGTCLRVGCIPSKALLESSHLYEEASHGMSEHGVQINGVELHLDKLMARKEKIVDTLTGGINMLFKKGTNILIYFI